MLVVVVVVVVVHILLLRTKERPHANERRLLAFVLGLLQ